MDSNPRLVIEQSTTDAIVIRIAGEWALGEARPDFSETLRAVSAAGTVTFDTTALGKWDTSLITGLISLYQASSNSQTNVDWSGLPQGPETHYPRFRC